MAVSPPSAASSRTPSLPFTNTLANLRHLVKCCQESTQLPPTHDTSDQSKRQPVHAIEQSDISLNLLKSSLARTPSSSSVLSVCEDGYINQNLATTQHTLIGCQSQTSQEPSQEPLVSYAKTNIHSSREDTFNHLGTINQPCIRSASLQKHSPPAEYMENYTVPLTKLTDEKDIGVVTTVTMSSLTSSSVLSKPKIKFRHRVRDVCLHWFTAYRILIGLTFAVNIAVLAVMIRGNRHDHPAISGSLIAAAANIFAAVFIRQEDLINVSFSFVAKTPVSLPLWLRKIIADFHHYGGLHIGCSISALLWYCCFVFLDTSHFLEHTRQRMATGWMWADIITCYAFLLAILCICVLAHPHLRVRFHDAFEQTHRFGGWTALLVLWLNAGVSSCNPNRPPLYANAALWLLAGTTFLIALPWTRIRRVAITTEPVSSREVKVTFPYKNMPYTSTTRFSLSPVLEWHAFATIPCSPSSDNPFAYIVISQAGDWTKAMIKSPPTHIWVRKPAAKNFLSFAPLFNSLLLVATGAGIGPLISLLCSPAIARMREQGRQIRVMWCVYDPDAAHWQFVQDIIRNVDPEPKIFDSREGRPDLAFEADFMKEQYGIEAVMIVSNPMVTREIVEKVKAKDGAAYGAVFDS